MAADGGDGGSAAAAGADEADCDLFQCFCRWRKRCSPRVPRVSPGKDYVCIPASATGDGEGDGPRWSVLVGCTSAGEQSHNLRTHRFRVAASGRVMGCSDDLLERFRGMSPDDEDVHTVFSSATAAMAPDGRNLCIICARHPSFDGDDRRRSGAEIEEDLQPKTFLMDCADRSLTALPPLPFRHGSYEAVSAHGQIWAPAIVEETGPSSIKRRLVVYQLVTDISSWAQIRDVDFPYQPSVNIPYGGTILQGYVVIGNRFILMSFVDSSFYCLDCVVSTLVRVTTTANCYVPISGRAVHVSSGDDDGIYFLRGDSTLFRYSYTLEGTVLKLEPPKVVDAICPFRNQGYGFVVHLQDGILCTVWASMNLPCTCATRHVLITTFRVKGQHGSDGFEPKGIEVLHSTCRRVSMLRSKALAYRSYDTFCFLQEYLDHAPKIDPSIASMMGGRSSYPQVDEEGSEMLTCCRKFLSKHVSSAVVLEYCKVETKSDFYFICQVDQQTHVHRISTVKGKLTCHQNVLDPQLSLHTIRPGDVGLDDPPAWHFISNGIKLYAIPSFYEGNHYEVDVEKRVCNLFESKRPNVYFSAVFRAGQHIVAIADTLQYVYVLDQQTFQWGIWNTLSSSLDLEQKVTISGFVDLVNDAFMISDVNMSNCFLLDLKKKEWFIVEPPIGDIWQYCVGWLSGTCVFAEGFIYICTEEGLEVFELIKKDTSYQWSAPVKLKFSWKRFSSRKAMSVCSICKERIGEEIVFCVVEARPFVPRYIVASSRPVAATIVQVKLQETT